MANDHGISSYVLANGQKRYRVRLMAGSKPYKWEGFETISEARDWRDDRKQDARQGRPFPILEPVHVTRTIASVIENYLIDAQHKKNIAGERIYARFWIAQHGSRDPASLIPDDIATARRLLLTVGVKRGPLAPATVNRYVSWYHHVLQVEVENETLVRNPCRKFIKSSKKGGHAFTEREAPDAVWTDEELIRLAHELGPKMRYPLFAILTGLRQGEQFGLKKGQLDLVKGLGYLLDTKANEGQIFDLNADAREIAADLMAEHPDSPWLFPHRTKPDTPINGKSWYNHVFKPAAARAGILLSRKDGKTWHTLRHSFADRLVEQNVHIHEVQQAGRWNSESAMKRYLKKRRDRVAAGVGLLKSPLPLVRKLYGASNGDDVTHDAKDLLAFKNN